MHLYFKFYFAPVSGHSLAGYVIKCPWLFARQHFYLRLCAGFCFQIKGNCEDSLHITHWSYIFSLSFLGWIGSLQWRKLFLYWSEAVTQLLQVVSWELSNVCVSSPGWCAMAVLLSVPPVCTISSCSTHLVLYLWNLLTNALKRQKK